MGEREREKGTYIQRIKEKEKEEGAKLGVGWTRNEQTMKQRGKQPEGNRETKREKRRRIVGGREKIEGAAWYETNEEKEIEEGGRQVVWEGGGRRGGVFGPGTHSDAVLIRVHEQS